MKLISEHCTMASLSAQHADLFQLIPQDPKKNSGWGTQCLFSTVRSKYSQTSASL